MQPKILFFSCFISPSPGTNTILYSCYLKETVCTLLISAQSPAVSNWDAAAGADRVQSIPDSATIFFRATQGSACRRRLSLVYFKTGSSQVAQRRLKKVGSQMPEWLREKGSIFRVKHQFSLLWIVLCYCALVPLNCVDDEGNIVKTIKNTTWVLLSHAQIQVLINPFIIHMSVVYWLIYSYKAFSQQKKEWKQEKNC